MKPKLLYCLSLAAIVALLSFTLVQRDSKNCGMISCTKIKLIKNPAEDTSSNNGFIFFQAFSKHLTIEL